MKTSRISIGIGLLCVFTLTTLWAQKPVGSVVAGVKGTTAFSASELNKLVNAGVLGSQPTQLPAKNGTYGIIFQDYKAYNLYKDRILDHLDDFIEAASLNLNPSNDAITTLLIAKLDARIDEQTSALEGKNCGSKRPVLCYDAYRATLRKALQGVDYAGILKGNDPIGFFSSVINEAAVQQCISYCEMSFQDYAMFHYKNQKSTIAGADAAFYVLYLLSYENVAKQDNPVFKSLYDAYVARKTNAEFANYKSLSKYHGSQMPFTIFQLPFGKLASTFVDSEKLKSYTTLLWDTTCNCPSAASFVNAVEAQKLFFTVP